METGISHKRQSVNSWNILSTDTCSVNVLTELSGIDRMQVILHYDGHLANTKLHTGRCISKFCLGSENK